MNYPPLPSITEARSLIPFEVPHGILLQGLATLRAIERGHLEGYPVALPADPALSCDEHREAEMLAWLLFRHRWGWGAPWPGQGSCWCIGYCKRREC